MRLDELNMTQKEFSKRTGIAESTISDWSKKKTNPTAEKILIICNTIDVSPEWLLSGIEAQGKRGNPQSRFVISADTEPGKLISIYNSLDAAGQERLMGYAEALAEQKNIDR